MTVEALARLYLYAAGGLFLVVFALPLLLAPLAWARVFRWTLPDDTRLAVYFGRCLGAVSVGLIVGCFRAASAPREHLLLFEVLGAVGVLLTLVHVWGAVRRVQPWTETAEIALYVVATAGAIGLRAAL